MTESKKAPQPIQTDFTKLLGCEYPIIAGPMFLVSYVELVTAVSEAGGVGTFPSLNWKKAEDFRKAIREVKSRTKKPFGVNLIVNKSNPRLRPTSRFAPKRRFRWSSPRSGIRRKRFEECTRSAARFSATVTTLDYAKKVQDLGADGVIGVSAGAGGHAGPISPMVLIPHLRNNLKIPVVAAGGIATGDQIAAALLLGASAVQIGTRFIATHEAKVDAAYKNAILNAEPEDIVMTERISGTPAAVIRTPYIDKIGLKLNPFEAFLHKNEHTKKYMKMLRLYIGSKALAKAASMPTWKEVWSAGQGVGLIEDIEPAATIVHRLAREYREAAKRVCT